MEYPNPVSSQLIETIEGNVVMPREAMSIMTTIKKLFLIAISLHIKLEISLNFH